MSAISARTLLAAAVGASLMATSALAQTSSSAAPATTVPGVTPGSAAGARAEMPREFRASKLIGSSIYNEQNESVGTLDDVLMAQDKQPVRGVVSVGGFLGIGSKLVEVPYERLRFEQNNRVVMPNATKDELTKMESFAYSSLYQTTGAAAGSGTVHSTGSTAGTSVGASTGTGTLGASNPGQPSRATSGATNAPVGLGGASGSAAPANR